MAREKRTGLWEFRKGKLQKSVSIWLYLKRSEKRSFGLLWYNQQPILGKKNRDKDHKTKNRSALRMGEEQKEGVGKRVRAQMGP